MKDDRKFWSGFVGGCLIGFFFAFLIAALCGGWFRSEKRHMAFMRLTGITCTLDEFQGMTELQVNTAMNEAVILYTRKHYENAH